MGMRTRLVANKRFWIVMLWGSTVILLGILAYVKLYIFRETNVILISIDTLRSDRLSCYGYKYKTSPHIDKLAEEGVLFENIYAQSPWTLPSHMSILTSLYPSVHGVQTTDDRLSGDFITLAEVLRNNGYYTAAYVDCGFVSAKYGFNQGFDIYDDYDYSAGRIKGINKKAISFIEKFCATRKSPQSKFFLLYHVFDVHGPYKPPESYRSLFYDGTDPYDRDNHSMDLIKQMSQHKYQEFGDITDINYVRALYDSGVRYVDDQLKDLFKRLKDLGIYDETLIVFTSDHGESLFEHEMMVGHGLSSWNTVIKVPLIVKFPYGKYRGRRVNCLTESIDIFPTVLDFLGIKNSIPIQGKSLMKSIRDRSTVRKFAYGSSSNPGGSRFVVSKRWKYIEAMKYNPDEMIGFMRNGKLDYLYISEHLYDMEADPQEMNNLARRQEEEIKMMVEKLKEFELSNEEFRQRYYSSVKGDIKIDMDEKLKEDLKALGYLQ